MSSVAVLTLIADAFQELNVFLPGESIPAAQGTFALRRLNQILDQWNANPNAAWTERFTSFTLSPGLSPHTIGPTGTFSETQRPTRVTDCRLILNTQTPDVYLPVDLIDRQAYESLTVPDLSTDIPTVVYYEPDWPNGKLFFYPVPDAAYGVRLSLNTLLSNVLSTDTLNLPMGYESALMFTLCESIATGSGTELSPITSLQAARGRAVIFANNVPVPRLNLQQGQQRDDRGCFNYHSRSYDQ